jgi:hypothetical protein
MTITASPASSADALGVHPARSLSMPARTAAAVTLVLSFALHAASLLIMRVTGADLAHGGDIESWLTWVADNPALANLSKTLDVLFVPFAVGSVVIYVLLGKARSPRLAWVGGVLYAGGLVSLASMEGFEAFAYMLATEQILDPQAIADIYIAPSSPAYIAAQTLFLLGVTIGLVITVVSLWRSRAVPRAAAIGLLLFLVGELTGLRVEGHLIGLASATWIAIVILRAPRATRAAD